MAVAERLYLRDSKLFEFRAKVTDIREFARKDGVQVWHLALDRTAFYPTGGGQPHDTGVLRAQSRSGAALAVPVEEVVEDSSGEVWHATSKPLLAGTEVAGMVDGERRFDHRQQHSGQHLLSAVLADQFGARTVSFHLGAVDSTIDLALESKEEQARLTEQLPEVEQRVNGLITQNLPTTVREVSQSEAQALLAFGAVRKLPPREGPIRLVEILGVDLNACGGTHVAALGEIGVMLLRETERVKGALRLHFVCGGRAVRAARADWTELTAASGALSVGTDGIAAAVVRLQAEARALTKERRALREELAAEHAVRLAVEEHTVDDLRVVCRVYPDRDAEYIKLLAGKLLAAVPNTAAILASTIGEPATVIVGCNIEGRSGCNTLLRDVLAPLGLRSGGTPDLAQAHVPGAPLQDIMASLEQSLRHPESL